MRGRNRRHSFNGNGQRNGNRNGYRSGRNQRTAGHVSGKNGKGESNVPSVILGVPGTDLEFGVWPESGCWGPALITPDDIVRRSYDPEHLLDYPALLRIAIGWYLNDAKEFDIELPARMRSELSDVASKLEEHFEVAA